jgi:hypothetical protein
MALYPKREEFPIQSPNIELHRFLIAVRYAEKTGHLVDQKACPHPRDENQNDDSDQKIDGLGHEAVSGA